MKAALLFPAVFFLSLISYGNYDVVNSAPEKIVKYEPNAENSLVLPTDYGRPFIVNKEQLAQLENNTIYHVELVYTAYKGSPTFNQEQLNTNRVTQVLALIPQLSADKPTWSLVEQIGAVTKAEANTYFHGFVIHYSKGLNHRDLGEFFEDYQQNIRHYHIDNGTGGTYTYNSGTSLTVPPNAVVDMDGNAVSGSYSLSYREFRNPAEIAFSGLPMTYSENGTEYNFSSVGMYEITAEKDGEELKLQAPITIDFNCTAVKEDVGFYQMDEKGEWEKVNDINFGEAEPKDQKVEGEPAKVTGAITEVISDNPKRVEQGLENNLTMSYKAGASTTHATMNKGAWNSYQRLKLQNDSLFSAWVVSDDQQKKQAVVRNQHFQAFNRSVMHQRIEDPNDKAFVINVNANATLLGGGDPGHTYPTVVKGLNSPEFGVYNCDQVYRMGNTVALAPTYVDETGKEIRDKHVACVMDLNYNGAFSFHPNRLTCNAAGKNVILLFTEQKDIYMLSAADFSALDKTNQRPTFVMRNITEKIKTSDDLKAILGI
jgi:hypothetical protein